MKKGKKPTKPLTQDQLLMKMPTVLIDNPNLIFTDRLGNILKPGKMICYAQNNSLRVGVFVGLLERSVKKQRYRRGYRNLWVQDSNATRGTYITFSILNRRGHCRNFYQEFDLSKNPEGCSLDRFVVIERPEFKVNDVSIGKLFSLIDDLKDGILKNYVDDDDEFADDDDEDDDVPNLDD